MPGLNLVDRACAVSLAVYTLEEKRWHILDSVLTSRHHFADKGPYSQSYGFSTSHGWMWELGHKEGWGPEDWGFWTVMLEKTQGDQISQSRRKSILNIHWKDWCWSWSSNTLATWCEEPTHWKKPWCWERFKAGGEGDNRGWDSWMASPTQWTWVWASSGRWWGTRKPGVLPSMGSQRVGHNWVTEQQQQNRLIPRNVIKTVIKKKKKLLVSKVQD